MQVGKKNKALKAKPKEEKKDGEGWKECQG